MHFDHEGTCIIILYQHDQGNDSILRPVYSVSPKISLKTIKSCSLRAVENESFPETFLTIEYMHVENILDLSMT